MTTVSAWLVRLEARLGVRLTRKEHEEICSKSNTELTKKLDRIEFMLEKQNLVFDRQNEHSLQHRQWVGDALGMIRTQVAVIRTKMGDDPLDDTVNGMFKNRGPQ